MKNRHTGINARTEAAIIWPQSTANFPTKCSSPTENVFWSSLLMSMRAKKFAPRRCENEGDGCAHSRQGQRQNDAPAPEPGATIDHRRSSRSRGTPSKKDCMRNVAKAILKAV